MLFTSYTFLLLFGLLIMVLRLTRIPPVMTVNLASIVFYGAWDPFCVLLMGFCIGVAFLFGRILEDRSGPGHGLAWPAAILILAPLLYFKYQGLALEFLADLTSLWGPRPGYSTLNIILPVGISFYTFQALGYVLDVRAGRIPACRSFSRLFMFVSFFPQLIAGPIMRGKDLLPQVEAFAERIKGRIDWLGATDLFVRGFIKKAVFADTFAVYVDRVYGQLGEAHLAAIGLATFFFTLQIYCDFSGYTDMARGLGRALGVDLSINFDNPYFAKSIRDFWNRWHITLSNWFRDYVYIPLGGNRLGPVRTQINLLATMLLCGLWHGAEYTFILWGGFHGLLLALNRFWSTKVRVDLGSLPAWLLTITAVGFGWFIFRVESPADLVLVLERLARAYDGGRFFPAQPAAYLLAVLFIGWQAMEVLVLKERVRFKRLGGFGRASLAAATVLFGYIFQATSDEVFIYFQF